LILPGYAERHGTAIESARSDTATCSARCRVSLGRAWDRAQSAAEAAAGEWIEVDAPRGIAWTATAQRTAERRGLALDTVALGPGDDARLWMFVRARTPIEEHDHAANDIASQAERSP